MLKQIQHFCPSPSKIKDFAKGQNSGPNQNLGQKESFWKSRPFQCQKKTHKFFFFWHHIQFF